ncbi:MAG: sigma-70 family RNA polymerase sigma factor [Dehalococcoidia bacterium]
MRDHEVMHDARIEGDAAVEALARRAAAREASAWGEIFELHYRAIFAFVRYRLRGADEAEDIAAQVFEVAYSRADRFDFRGAPIQAWLLGIARNLLRDHAKKLGRRGIPDELDELNAPAEPDAAAAVDLRHDLSTAMRSLTADQQEVIVMRFLLDKSVVETAELMSRSEDAVKNLQRRALAAMLRALAEAGYPGAVGT